MLKEDFPMRFNFFARVKFAFGILSKYKNGLSILLYIVLGKIITKLILKNGITIIGGRRSLILEITDEIFFKRVYTPSFMTIKKGDTVFDVGANVGVFSVFSAKKGAFVYAIEPLEENVKLIVKNAELNGFTNIKIIQKAIGRMSGKKEFYLSDADPHGSLKGEGESVTVSVTTLQNFLWENKIKKIDFLKIDVEGGEGEIIVSFDGKLVNNIEKIALEYHNNLSSLTHSELIDRLKLLGYKTKLLEIDQNLGYIYAYR